jgi:hypothetical protein
MSGKERFEMQASPQHNASALISVEQSRAVQEVQAALVIAKKFPRDEIQAMSKIKEACSRPALAGMAVYSYPRGGQKVEGPSIRLAEELARNWGNLSAGIRELERGDGYSKMEAYCWDQETNVRIVREFDVQHIRDTKGGPKKLEDSRDIYEMTANQGARRLRATILAVIPGYVVDEALDQCNRTLKGQSKIPLKDRITKMVEAFKSQFSVSQSMIEKRVGHKVESLDERELLELGKIFNSLKDGFSSREDWFEISNLADQVKQKDPDQQQPATAPKETDNSVATDSAPNTPQEQFYAALGEHCGGDVEAMQGTLNQLLGNDKHPLSEIPAFTEDATLLLSNRLQKLAGG